MSADRDIEAVLAANRAFYDAHENRDLGAMAGIWEQDEDVVCTHPGWPILRGWPLVEESWRGIFSGPGRNQFICTNESVRVEGDIAWVTLDENLVDGARTSTIAATNVFARRGDRWLMIVHHGSVVVSR